MKIQITVKPLKIECFTVLNYTAHNSFQEARMTKLTAANQKPLILWCPNFVTLFFILKTCSNQILAKLINQGVAASLFSWRRPKKLENEKVFLCLKIAEIEIKGQFWVEKNDSGHKNSFFFKR